MTLADGVAEKRPDGTTVLRFERHLAHPILRVWEALTDRARMLDWWGDAYVELEEGGRFSVRWLNTDDDGNAFTMEATVSELDPPRVLEIESDPAEGHGRLRFELEPVGDETVLRFTSELRLPDEHRTRTLAGWHLHLDALARALDGGHTDLVNLPEWEGIHSLYAPTARRASSGLL